MGQAKLLDVAGRQVLTTEVTYDDLVILYKQYIEKYGEVPIFSKCDAKHNMPQGRIINRVIAEKGITYNDFLLQFGKVSHVRTESKDYDLYVKRFKEISDRIGHALVQKELFNDCSITKNELKFLENTEFSCQKEYNKCMENS